MTTTILRFVFMLALVVLAVNTLAAQTGTIQGRVTAAAEHHEEPDEEAQEEPDEEHDAPPVVGATVRLEETRRGAITRRDGSFTITDVPAGTHRLQITSIGYAAVDTTVVVTAGGVLTLDIILEEEAEEGEEVVVTATRTQRSIDDVPVRVEVVPQEEVEEKLLMSPSNVAMLLNESTGMRVQTTSPTTNTANLRIQGLPGRYTQILVDGIPNVGGLAAGFGLTELPPLNLRQVEIIKGAASALYGADAISGVVNFITKDPRPEPELSALVNYTSQKGLDLAGFYGQRFDDFGFTVLASRNTQSRFDVDGDGFADVTEYTRWTLYPKLTYSFSEDVAADLAFGYLADERLGGAATAQESDIGSNSPYLEHIESQRLSGSGQLSWNIGEDQAAVFKAAGMRLERDAQYGATPFNATQQTLYLDGQYSIGSLGAHNLLVGGTFSLEDFADQTAPATAFRSYTYNTIGILAQDEFEVSEEIAVIASGRLDLHNVYGTFFTPRISLMYRPSSAVTMRIGGGTGFKAPTIFVEEVEERGFRNAYLSADAIAERSQSGSFDINWKTIAGDLGINVNGVAYLTRLEDALITDPDSARGDVLFLRNATGTTLARGAELSLKFTYEDFKLSLGYTYLDATQTDRDRSYELALNPRHSLGTVFMWESEEAGTKVGLEAYWTGSQRLEGHPTRDRSPSYLVTGFLIEKAFGPIRVFFNAENFLDTRQTRFEPIILGNPMNGPVETLPIYAPLEGRVFNGGIRFVLGSAHH